MCTLKVTNLAEAVSEVMLSSTAAGSTVAFCIVVRVAALAEVNEESECAVAVFNKHKYNLAITGNKDLVCGIGNCNSIVENCVLYTFTQITVGHIVDSVICNDCNIAILCEFCNKETILEYIIVTVVICSVDEAVKVVSGLSSVTLCTYAVNPVMVAVIAADCTVAVYEIMLNYRAASKADAVDIVLCVLTFRSNVAECKCIVTVVDESKCYFSALGNIYLISPVAESLCVIKFYNACILALISVCHIPVGIIVGLDSNVGCFVEC